MSIKKMLTFVCFPFALLKQMRSARFGRRKHPLSGSRMAVEGFKCIQIQVTTFRGIQGPVRPIFILNYYYFLTGSMFCILQEYLVRFSMKRCLPSLCVTFFVSRSVIFILYFTLIAMVSPSMLLPFIARL